uniref:Si:ch211-188c16.1 n=1 Tax=Fundulus heteroclitus TaxID=8078 RepID=A0A3Q2QRT9_FUNHE
MEEEGQINFKALRAKFQEEALLARSKNNRPAVAEKPKLLQPYLGHCSSVDSGIATAVESQTPESPRVLFRDGHRSSGGKRPISFPPHSKQTSPSPKLANGDGSAKHSLKDRHMPLVLPVPPVKDHRADVPDGNEHKQASGTGKEVFPHTKMKKKGLLLPFKSAKGSKYSADNGEEPPCGDLPIRPCSALSDSCSMEKQSIEERASLQSDQSISEYLASSPEFSVTPPPPETYPDSDNRILSTLEKAKRKLSRRQVMIPTKPKGLPSPDYPCREKTFPSSPKYPDGVGSGGRAPPPTCLPHLACISARPFVKANNSARKPAFAGQLRVRPVEPFSPRVPLKKPLPELWTLGPVPVKPPRPPTVDLSSYRATLVKEVSPGWCQTPRKLEVSALHAPDFPDFEISELETAEGEPVDIAALETGALDVVVGKLSTPIKSEVADYEAPGSASLVGDPAESKRSPVVQDLNLGSPHIIPLDPASFPEPVSLPEFPEPTLPERPSYSEEAAVDDFPNSRSEETDAEVVESRSVPEETELVVHSTSNHETQTQPIEPHQNSYYETFDNVYEDVEIKKFLASQMSTKQKNILKNPYVDSQSKKRETSLHKRTRHPWQHTSPNTADHKEQKKREKHRLEKERKEQKEREKKENEMKKKFKVTGEEEPMYHAKVTVASKVRKNDLPVKNGDTVSIIRTTNCPKGKWLARDANHKYGYISVMNVELNIKDMLELGKKAQAAGRGACAEPDTISIGSRSSNPPLLTSSFTDDSEEWACEDETLSPSYESHIAQQTVSEQEMSCVNVDAQHTLSDSNLEELHTQSRNEALQKLALLIQHSKDDLGDGGAASVSSDTSSFLCAVEEPPYPEQEIDFTEMELLPPPPLYADSL